MQRRFMEERFPAPAEPALPCGNPNCPDPSSTVRLQFIPRDFSGPRVLGATSFHRKKADCARHFGVQDPPRAPGRKRREETLTIPVGKRLETDKCPPFLRAIHDLWGHRYIPLAPYACTPPHTGYCAGRRADISEMRTEERSQPLPGSIIEYIVHGEFAWQDDDTNSTYGAWWVPLRSMVEEVGKEEVEQKLDEFDAEVKRLRSLVIDAVANSSEDEVQGEDE